MTEPALRSLKRANPHREIHLLTSSSGAAAAAMINSVDKIIVSDLPWMSDKNKMHAEQIKELAEELRAHAYEAAIIFNVYSQNPLPPALLCLLAGITEVAAYCRENPYGLLSCWIPDEEPLFRIRHEVMRQYELALFLGGANVNKRIRINLDEKLIKDLRLRFPVLNTEDPLLVLHPGASEARRRYPATLFREFAAMAREQCGYRILVTGSEYEKDLVSSICEVSPEGIYDLSGLLDLNELAALIASTSLLVSNNTGPVHLAAATGTPVVVLYAQTNPQHTPWMVEHAVLPFDVPVHQRSRNSLIRYAHEQSFNHASVPDPGKILKAVQLLLAKPKEHILK